MADNLNKVSMKRFNEALDVMFGDCSDEEIQAWFAAQPDGDKLSALVLTAMMNDSSDNPRRRAANG